MQKKENRAKTIKSVSKDLDLRDRWLGIRNMKKVYQPVPYTQKDPAGRNVKVKDKAEGAAMFFETRIWQQSQTSTNEFTGPQIVTEQVSITLTELRQILRKFKRRKSPGPDEIPMEMFKEMDDDVLAHLLEILNEWWVNDNIPEEQLQSRIVLIFN